jgi:hypothetical protein
MDFQEKLNQIEELISKKKQDDEDLQFQKKVNDKQKKIEQKNFEIQLASEMKAYKEYVYSRYDILIEEGVQNGLVDYFKAKEIKGLYNYNYNSMNSPSGYVLERVIWRTLSVSLGIMLILKLIYFNIFFFSLGSGTLGISGCALILFDIIFAVSTISPVLWYNTHKFFFFIIFKWYFRNEAKQLLLRDFATMKIKSEEL